MHLHYLAKLKIRISGKILMIEKRTQQTLLTITVARFYQNKHSMAMVDHKVGKHYFQVLAEMNKMVNTVWPR